MTADRHIDAQEMDEGDIYNLIENGEVEIPRYEDMTREELIETLHAHDAHHNEHHEREKYVPMLVDVIRECLHHAFGLGGQWEITHQYPERASDVDWIARKAADALSQLPPELRGGDDNR